MAHKCHQSHRTSSTVLIKETVYTIKLLLGLLISSSFCGNAHVVNSRKCVTGACFPCGFSTPYNSRDGNVFYWGKD